MLEADKSLGIQLAKILDVIEKIDFSRPQVPITLARCFGNTYKIYKHKLTFQRTHPTMQLDGHDKPRP